MPQNEKREAYLEIMTSVQLSVSISHSPQAYLAASPASLDPDDLSACVFICHGAFLTPTYFFKFISPTSASIAATKAVLELFFGGGGVERETLSQSLEFRLNFLFLWLLLFQGHEICHPDILDRRALVSLSYSPSDTELVPEHALQE